MRPGDEVRGAIEGEGFVVDAEEDAAGMVEPDVHGAEVERPEEGIPVALERREAEVGDACAVEPAGDAFGGDGQHHVHVEGAVDGVEADVEAEDGVAVLHDLVEAFDSLRPSLHAVEASRVASSASCGWAWYPSGRRGGANDRAMSKQFRLYVLPADAERLVREIHNEFGVRVLDEESSSMQFGEVSSPIREGSVWFEAKSSRSIRCYLAPRQSQIDLAYFAKLDRWIIQPESEAIQFSGADFDGNSLLIGRMYFQTDKLVEDMIVTKKKEFLIWADSVFRFSKRFLSYDRELDAYLGQEAFDFQKNGGTLISSFGGIKSPVSKRR